MGEQGPLEGEDPELMGAKRYPLFIYYGLFESHEEQSNEWVILSGSILYYNRAIGFGRWFSLDGFIASPPLSLFFLSSYNLLLPICLFS